MGKDLRNQLSVLVFCGFPPTDETGVHRFSKEIIRGLDSTSINHYSIFWKKDKGFVKSLLCLAMNYFMVIRNVNVVHFVVMTPIEIPFIMMSRILGKKIVTTYHGNYKMQKSITNNNFLNFVFSCGDKIFRKLSDVIVSPSKYLLDQLRIKDTTSCIIPNPYSFSKCDSVQNPVSIESSSFNIVTASNFNIKEKAENLTFLFEALNEILKDQKNIKLFIFGDGVYLDTYRTEYGSNENFLFMGFRLDFKNYLSHSDLYIHISKFDNQPYAIIDALFQRNVIICNNLEGLVEMIPADNNFIVPLEYSAIKEGILTAFREYKENNAHFKKRGISNRTFAELRYGAAGITEQYIQVYIKIIN